MRYVSLNLDLEDAAVLRRAIAGVLDRRDGSPLSSVDDDYRALHAVASELDRLIEAPARRRAGAVVNGHPFEATSRLTVIPGGRAQGE